MKRRWRSIAMLGLLAIVLSACSSDKPSSPETGILFVRAIFEASLLPDGKDLPSVDSLQVRVQDSEGNLLAGNRVSIPDSAETNVSFELAPGDGYQILAEADGIDGGVRGAVYFTRRTGVSVGRGQTTDVILLLRRAIPNAPWFDGGAGRSSYTVAWDRIPEATGYLLRETREDGSSDFVGVDTSRTFTPGLPRGDSHVLLIGDRLKAGEALAPRTTSRSYRVSARLPLGNGLLSDSSAIDLDLWFDLPGVVAISPADSAEGVPDTTRIQIAFDRPMDASTLQDTLVSLRNLDTGWPVECEKEILPDNSTVVLTPLEPLPRGAWVRTRVSADVQDEMGRPLDQDPAEDGLQAFVSDFRTEEYDPLRVIEVVPEDGAADVEATAVVLVHFNRAVDQGAAGSADHFFVVDSSGVVPGTRRRLDDGLTLQFRGSRPFVHDVRHEVYVETSLLDDQRGEPLDQDPVAPGLQRFVSGFRTVSQPRGPRVVASTPISGEPHHPVFEDLVIVFDRPIDPATVIIGDGLQVKVTLGGVEYNLPGVATTSDDSLHVTFTPGGDFERDKDHRIVVVASENGIRDGIGSRFDQEPATPGFQDHEIVFQTEQNPRVTDVTPWDGMQGVAWAESVRVRFDMPIQPESVDAESFLLYSGETPLPARRRVSIDNTEAFLIPQTPLGSYRVYRVVVGPGIRSWRGGMLDQDFHLDGYQAFESTFRTIAETDPPQVVEADPSDGQIDFPVEGSVQVIFSEPIRPELVPDYFYLTKDDSLGARVLGAVDVGGDSLSARFVPDDSLSFLTVYHLHVETWIRDRFDNRLDQDLETPGWQGFHSTFRTRNETDPPYVVGITPIDGASGVRLDAQVTIDFSEPMDRGSLELGLSIETDGDPVTGLLAFQNDDQRVVWTSIGDLRPDHLYRLRVDSLALDLAGNRFDQVPLTLPLDPFESAFRTEADTVGPFVESIDPADGSTGVSIGIHPTIVFSEPIDPGTINAGSVALVDSAGGAVSAARFVSGEGRSVTISPDSPLEFDSAYRVLISSAVEDTIGNPFDAEPGIPGSQSFSSSFRTQQETIPPEVLGMILDGPVEDVPIETSVRVVFSEPIDPATVGATTFALLRGEIEVPSSRTIATSGDTATLTPDAPLLNETDYQVFVGGVRDLVGNLLDQDPDSAGVQTFNAFFNTEEDQIKPRVLQSMPPDGANDVDPGTTLRLIFSEPMDEASFFPADPGLWLDGFPVAAERTAEAGDASFLFEPEDPLVPGETYEWRAGTQLQDLNGNYLDQDPDSPSGDPFTAEFTVAQPPVADAGNGVCADSALTIAFDASGSSDPNGEIVEVVWEWGDGSADTLAAPDGLVASHTYPCLDDAGCDGIDNDGDDSIDEADLPDGCDESYHVVLTVTDNSGLTSRDTTGVSFCAFRVAAVDPENGATDVDTLVVPTVNLTRAFSVSTLIDGVQLTLEDGTYVPGSVSPANGNTRVVITPSSPLLPDTLYRIHVTALFRSALGEPFDQEPCIPGQQESITQFRTIARPGAPSRPLGASLSGPSDARPSLSR